jgi:hypothetical protein
LPTIKLTLYLPGLLYLTTGFWMLVPNVFAPEKVHCLEVTCALHELSKN